MSKSIMLENQIQENDYIPVASESMFNDIYEPLAQKLGLDYIAKMAFGYDFEHSGLLNITTQFKTLRQFLLTQEPKLNTEYNKGWLVERLNGIINRLELEKDNTNIVGSII
jgi:hypothetical protein